MYNIVNISYGLHSSAIVSIQGGVLQKNVGSQVLHAKNIWTQSDLRFCEHEGSKRSKINEKGVNWIENQGKN